MALQLYNKMTHGVRYWLLRRLPTCQQLVPLMSESLERPLSLRERVLMKIHLWVCLWCARYLEQLHAIRDALRARDAHVSSDEPQSGISLSPEARERIKSLLKQTDQ